MYKPKYFNKAEMVCHCCGELPAKGISEELLIRLDKLREMCSAPIVVSCMYRCPSHNKAVGGVPNSQHVLCTAADIWCPSMTASELHKVILGMETFDGVGIYSNFVHVDCRDKGESPNIYRWEGEY